MSTIAITKSGKVQLGLAVIALFLLPIITVTLSIFEVSINVGTQIANNFIYALPYIGIYIWLLAAKGLPLNKCGKIGLTFLLVAGILALLNNIWYAYLQDFSYEYFIENIEQIAPIYGIAHTTIDVLIFIPGVILFYFGSRLPVATKILAVTTSIIFVLWGLSHGFLRELFYEMGDTLFVNTMINSLNLVIRILLFIPIIIVTLVWMSRNDYQSAEHSCDAA